MLSSPYGTFTPYIYNGEKCWAPKAPSCDQPHYVEHFCLGGPVFFIHNASLRIAIKGMAQGSLDYPVPLSAC